MKRQPEAAHELVERAIDSIVRNLRAGDLAHAMLGMNQAAHVLDADVGTALASFRLQTGLTERLFPETKRPLFPRKHPPCKVIDLAAWKRAHTEAE